jgi:hypothetical protein
MTQISHDAGQLRKRRHVVQGLEAAGADRPECALVPAWAVPLRIAADPPVMTHGTLLRREWVGSAAFPALHTLVRPHRWPRCSG